MYNLQNLEVVRISPAKPGIFALAKYSDWFATYQFLVLPDGVVKGKTISSGRWLELSQEATRIMRAKIQSLLRRKKVPIY